MEEQEGNHPREQTMGAAKEVPLSQRGILDISVAIFQGNFTHPFLVRKKKGGKTCFRDQTLNYKNNMYIPWEYVLQLRRLQRLQEMVSQKSATLILSPQVQSGSQTGRELRVQLCPKNFLFFSSFFETK